MKKISILIPVYNEEGNVAMAYNAIKDTMAPLAGKYDHEIVFTDNHSSDKTFHLLQELAFKDSRVKVARFSRNFGYQRSIYTGYMLSTGDAVVQFDCDLQDPPSLIPEFIKKWEEGNAVVYGIRMTRKESFLMKMARKLFYRLIDFLSNDNLPNDAGDFRLVDKKIVDQLRLLYDYNPYIRGLIASIGFNQVGIPYDRNERLHGKSKFMGRHLFNLALDGIINHSMVPLRLASYAGLIIFCGAIFLAAAYLVMKLFFHPTMPAGFTTTVFLILISLSLNALFLGIIGEYLGRLYQQMKRHPISIIETTINLDSKGDGNHSHQG